jgi:hypothetical protein
VYVQVFQRVEGLFYAFARLVGPQIHDWLPGQPTASSECPDGLRVARILFLPEGVVDGMHIPQPACSEIGIPIVSDDYDRICPMQVI